MSRMEIYAADKDGDVTLYGEADNAHGWAAHIWDKLMHAYAIEGDPEYKRMGLPVSMQDTVACRNLWRSGSLMSERDRWVMYLTFDYVCIPAEHLPVTIRHLRDFARQYPHSTLDEAIGILEKAASDENVTAILFNHTSGSSSPGWVYDGSGEEEGGRLYNVRTDDQHWLLTPEEAERMTEDSRQKLATAAAGI